MKTYILLILFVTAYISVLGQNIPIDFEETGYGADWVWTTFENDSNPVLEIVPNPDVSGINTSATVAKFTALSTGEAFAGCESMHGAGIGTFTVDQESATINIMVWKSVISDVGIKLVRADNWSLGEIKKANTKVNEWEELIFDFSAHIGNTYDQIVIFPDFKARGADNVIYFDNVYGEVMSTATKEVYSSSLKVFPIPSSDFLNIEAKDEIQGYKIYSSVGQLLDTQEVKNKQTKINLAQFNKGIYLLEANVNGQKVTRRFIKQ